MAYVTPREAAKYYNVTTTTLQTWANEGKIECKVLQSGHRRFKLEKLGDKKSFIYCRVSSAKQGSDLYRQVGYLRAKYPTHTVITDIGSGLNFERRGFKMLLEQLLQGNIKEVVVAYSDRWCRFGYEMFEWLFTKFGANLIADSHQAAKSKQAELTEDLMAILGIFNARYNGSRKYNSQEDSDQATTVDEMSVTTDV